VPALARSIVDELAQLSAAAADTYDRMGSIERSARRARMAGMAHVA
jgi:hypothetical protein